MNIRVATRVRYPLQIRFLTKEENAMIPDFEADTGEISVRYERDRPTVWCGLGERASCTAHTLRSGCARGIQRATDLKRSDASIIIPSLPCCGDEAATACVEGALLGSYRFDKYKSEKKPRLRSAELVGRVISRASVKRAESICGAVNYARDLVNENADVVTPGYLAAEAARIGRSAGMKTTVLDEKAIRREGLRLITAVGKGSPYPPRLVLIEYAGDRSSNDTTAVVGKGITFDSGGQNLKPTGSIETMRHDMAGAAVVLGLMQALSQTKARVNVVGVIAAAHNAIDSTSYFPGDVLTSYSGKTIEIANTDAEGRLVLADAIAYCLEKKRPARIIDLATLTGGVLSALGEFAAALFSNDESLATSLFDAGEATRERLWRLPLYKEYSDSMKGELADLRNTSRFKKGYASSITGAAFIQEFVGVTPWAHLDIAGVAFNESEARAEVPRFATGFGVRLVLEFLTRRRS